MVLGFLSGVVATGSVAGAPGLDPLAGIRDLQGVWAWLDNFCRLNTSRTYRVGGQLVLLLNTHRNERRPIRPRLAELNLVMDRTMARLKAFHRSTDDGALARLETGQTKLRTNVRWRRVPTGSRTASRECAMRCKALHRVTGWRPAAAPRGC